MLHALSAPHLHAPDLRGPPDSPMALSEDRLQGFGGDYGGAGNQSWLSWQSISAINAGLSGPRAEPIAATAATAAAAGAGGDRDGRLFSGCRGAVATDASGFVGAGGGSSSACCGGGCAGCGGCARVVAAVGGQQCQHQTPCAATRRCCLVDSPPPLPPVPPELLLRLQFLERSSRSVPPRSASRSPRPEPPPMLEPRAQAFAVGREAASLAASAERAAAVHREELEEARAEWRRELHALEARAELAAAGQSAGEAEAQRLREELRRMKVECDAQLDRAQLEHALQARETVHSELRSQRATFALEVEEAVSSGTAACREQAVRLEALEADIQALELERTQLKTERAQLQTERVQLQAAHAREEAARCGAEGRHRDLAADVATARRELLCLQASSEAAEWAHEEGCVESEKAVKAARADSDRLREQLEEERRARTEAERLHRSTADAEQMLHVDHGKLQELLRIERDTRQALEQTHARIKTDARQLQEDLAAATLARDADRAAQENLEHSRLIASREVERLRADCSRLQGDLDAAERGRLAAVQKAEELLTDRARLQTDLEAAERGRIDAVRETETLRAERCRLQAELEALRLSQLELERARAEAEERAGPLAVELEWERNARRELQRTSELASAEAERLRAAADSELSRLREEQQGVHAELLRSREVAEEVKRRHEETADELQRLRLQHEESLASERRHRDEDAQRCEAAVEKLQLQIEADAKEAEALRRRSEELSHEFAEASRNLQATEAARSSLVLDLEKARDDYARDLAALEASTKEVEARLRWQMHSETEGYEDRITTLLREGDALRGQLGVAAAEREEIIARSRLRADEREMTYAFSPGHAQSQPQAALPRTPDSNQEVSRHYSLLSDDQLLARPAWTLPLGGGVARYRSAASAAGTASLSNDKYMVDLGNGGDSDGLDEEHSDRS
eukprot:TRINITY_DN3751_c0_g1_i1.p1 TRINITY_DN3751_c0_g1~~TRINITY_DN3751_c0_g1_i1.p1  ORF type:complete len:931 (+),score=300.89 TRINITY_DN3751_c0_g1_i1:110-2902(+)